MKSAIPDETHRAQQIRKLTEVSRALTYAATLEEVFELTVARAADLLAAEKSLLLVADDDGLLSLRASRAVDAVLAERFREPLTEKLVPRLTALLGTPPECFLGVPLVVAGAIKGLLVVIRSTPSAVSEEDEWLLSALADQAAAALERSRLDEIGEFREQLIGIISHDLRSPLNTIHMGATILLQRTGLGEVETEVARKIARSSVLAARLIDQLLDLTRSRLGGGISIEPKRFDMMDVCRQVIGETELTHPDRPLRVAVQGNLIGVWDVTGSTSCSRISSAMPSSMASRDRRSTSGSTVGRPKFSSRSRIEVSPYHLRCCRSFSRRSVGCGRRIPSPKGSA